MCRRSLRKLAGLSVAAFAAAAVVALAPAAAHAGCGDYVHVGGAQPQDAPETAGSTKPADHLRWPSAPAVPPCHGSTCRGDLPTLPVPAPLPPLGGTEHWAVHCVETNPLSPDCRRVVPEVVSPPADGHLSHLERPPRSRS